MSITVNEGGVLYELDKVTVNEGGTLYELDSVTANESGTLYEIYKKGGFADALVWTYIRNLTGTTTWNDDETIVNCSYESNNVNTYDYMEGTLTLSRTTTVTITVSKCCNYVVTSNYGAYSYVSITASSGTNLVKCYRSLVNASPYSPYLINVKEETNGPCTITLEAGVYEIYVMARGPASTSYFYDHIAEFNIRFT